ncbi:MAG: hypothetical protein K9M55_00265 [Candidatus Marinimicrobia bacterium]|nr:hypothetical protein [Candidatus Neomarinimicrobiota bacterium]MCF7921110.1 hypothetical protein [Candidatus Neomarinimicrobiota bacterium]
MNFSTRTLVSLLVMTVGLWAHEHWLYTESPSYAIGDSIGVTLRSGHSPGNSEFLIDTQLIQTALIIRPDNTQEPIQLHASGNEHIAYFQTMTPGTYTILVNLRKRNKGPSIYLLKTQVRVGSPELDSPLAPTQELEIMPAGSGTSFSVFASADPVKVPLTLLAPDGSERSLIMDREGISAFTPAQAGFHVLICHFRRQTASYSVYIEE